MKPNSTGIAARMMLSIDRVRICEALLNNRQLQSTPLQIRYPQGVREALGIMSEQLSLSVSDLTRILVEDALTEMFLPAENIVHRLLCRTEHIMQAHDVCENTVELEYQLLRYFQLRFFFTHQTNKSGSIIFFTPDYSPGHQPASYPGH